MFKKCIALPFLLILSAASVLLSGCLCFNPFSGGGIDLPSIPGIPLPSGSTAAPSAPAGDGEIPPAPRPFTPLPPPPAPPAGTRVSQTGTLNLGAAVQMGNVNIDSSGNDLTMEAPGTPLNGMVFSVPQEAYASSRNYKFSFAPITSSTFKFINPVSPLITIDNGGEFAEAYMKIKVPVKLLASQFAMGFLYDKTTGKLEGMPLAGRDESSVTVATLHFSDFFISAIDAVLLKDDIDTGFRPGIDDWQFPNEGSYIAPGGHCAGQAVTALWYYVTKPDGQEATLYGRYDRNGDKPATPLLWMDDNRGYRLASMIQKSINWDSFHTAFWPDLKATDETTLRLFAYAMRATGEPQQVGIYSNAGGGHAMIVYRIKDGNLYIADPNYPGDNDRRIEYINGAFKPYNSGANKGEIDAGRGQAFETIIYRAKTTTVHWDRIAARWQEFKAGTIGNGQFPPYQLVYYDEKGAAKVLADGMVFNTNKVRFSVFAPAVITSPYRDQQSLLKDAQGRVTLQQGENNIGFYVLRKKDNFWEYVDFKYVKVFYQPDETPTPTTPAGKLAISPDTAEIVKGSFKEFTAVMAPSRPQNPLYEWLVNGVRKQGPAAMGIKFTFRPDAEGDFTLTVNEYDSATNRLTASATARISVTEPTVNRLAQLQGQKYLRGAIYASLTYDYWEANKGSSTKVESMMFITPKSDATGSLPITWNGTRFTASSTTYPNKYTLTGTVSADGTTLTSLTLDREWLGKGDYATIHWKTRIALTGPFPIWNAQGLPTNRITGSGAAKYVGSLSETRTYTYTASGEKYETWTYRSIDWSSANAAVTLTFQNQP